MTDERAELTARESENENDRDLSRRINELNEKILQLKKSISY